jgi:hypothetical protein
MWFDPKTIMFLYVLYGGLAARMVWWFDKKDGLAIDI